MTNGYFDSYTPLPRNTLARAEAVNAIFDAVIVGFDKLPNFDAVTQDRVTFCTDTGAANAYVITPTFPIASYIAGQKFSFVAVHANTMASSLNVSGLGIIPIKRYDGTDLKANDILAGQLLTAEFDGTNFQLVSVAGSDLATAIASAATAVASQVSATASAASATSSASSATASAAAAAASAVSAALRPTRQIFTTGTSLTYTTPVGVRQLRIRMCGGCGGGGGSGTSDGGNGNDGTNTSFNSIVASAGKGALASANVGGPSPSAGAGSASYRARGQAGQSAPSGGATAYAPGGLGGCNMLGKFGGVGAAISNVASSFGGGGGGASEYVEMIINSPAGTYTYTVGTGGAGGSAGTSGAIAAAGDAGLIIVDEIY